MSVHSARFGLSGIVLTNAGEVIGTVLISAEYNYRPGFIHKHTMVVN